MQWNWKARAQAAAVHLGVSSALAALAAVLVLLVWFPDPYRHVAGGIELLALLIGVDVVLGPALTLVIFNRAKPRAELVRDLSVIALLQLAALGYGLTTAFQARPVYLVYEVDRFRVVRASDIDPTDLAQAALEFRKLPLHSVRVIGARPAQSNDELFKSIESALAGRDIGLMPQRWEPLGPTHVAEMRKRARSLQFLQARARTDAIPELQRLIAESNATQAEVVAVPMLGRRDDWSALIDLRDLRIIGYVPVDSF